MTIVGYTDHAQLEKALRRYIWEGSGYELPIIPGNDFQPAPETPYASLLMVDDKARGTPNVWQAYDSVRDLLNITEQQLRSATYHVQWFRSGDIKARVSMHRAYQFAAWCHSDLGVHSANRIGIRLAACSDVKRMDVEEAGEWEERYVVEMMVDYFQLYEYDAGYLGAPPDEADVRAYIGRRIQLVRED